MTVKRILKFLFLCVVFLVVGCASEPYNQGNYADISLIKGKEGVWSRQDVEQAIGSPSFTDPHNSLIVYYVGVKGYKYPILSPTIQKSAVLMLEYNSQGKLKKISEKK